MTLEAVYFLSQVVAAIALVGSLIFVGIQLREGRKQAEFAERTARAQVHQNFSESFRLASLDWANTPEAMKINQFDLPPEDISLDNKVVFFTKMFATMKLAEDLHFQYTNGMIPEEQFRSYLGFVANLSKGRMATEWWDERKAVFLPAFVEMLDEVRADATPTSETEYLKRARAADHVRPEADQPRPE